MTKAWKIFTGLLLLLLFNTIGCGPSGNSLSGEELQKKYPEEKYVQIDGVSLRYKQEGLGRPVILLHDVLVDSDIWRNIIPGLTFGKTLYSLDLMGSVLSEKPQNRTYSIDTYGTQVSKFTDDSPLQN